MVKTEQAEGLQQRTTTAIKCLISYGRRPLMWLPALTRIAAHAERVLEPSSNLWLLELSGSRRTQVPAEWY